MKKIRLLIQSISDIITNSSTEVFMVYDKRAFDDIKDLVNAILNINKDNEYTFDDLFEIKESFDEEEFLYQYPQYKSLKDDEIIEKAHEIDDENYGEGSPYVNGYIVKAKNPKNNEVAEKLSNINRIFETYACYC